MITSKITNEHPRASTKLLVCRVCKSEGEHQVHTAREMMYGTRESFEYFQCGNCGCLQISVIPKNLGSYYRQDYYSLSADHSVFYRNPLKNFLNLVRDRAALFLPGGVDLPLMVKVPHITASFNALRRVSGLSVNTRILDVGCGSGQLLYRLRNAGFRDLTGIDPFLPEDKHVDECLRIKKQNLADVAGVYDLIILNHSFEHVSDPMAVAAAIVSKLSDRGIALIRIPVADSAAWQEYGVDWFQLDAPRHLYLHTRKSMDYIVQQVGLTKVDEFFDSGPEQFVMSERYRRGLPMVSVPGAVRHSDEAFEITRSDMSSYSRRAMALNASGQGDQVSLYFRRR